MRARVEYLRTLVVTLDDGREVRFTVQIVDGHKRTIPAANVAQADVDTAAVAAAINAQR